ncbi:expressed unknown protein [Seminavis robusta]|uniref:Uncharacterized protein n=1 Tax=Seminavis robusta TaxID=568900 RepID=A0A9N8H337_9STRA|nr:expressed unknown protein [Seminavis robusta]|eukprot:Sro50_g029040.1 n/a (204) ;mRNA; r:61984-62595
MAPPPAPLPETGALRVVMRHQRDPATTTPDDSSSSPTTANPQLFLITKDCDKYWQKVLASKDIVLRAQKQYQLDQNNQVNQKAFGMARNELFASAWHYKFCLSHALCPRPTRVYNGCWQWAQKELGDEELHEMRKHRLLDTVCKPEREMMERCIGRLVSTVVQKDLYPTTTSGIYSNSMDPLLFQNNDDMTMGMDSMVVEDSV